MTLPTFDLGRPELSYMFGFLMADGSLEGQPDRKGKLRVELGFQDWGLLGQFQKLTSVYSSLKDRTRDTNFKDDAHTAIWTVYNMGFRQVLFDLGLPIGKKSRLVEPPRAPYIKRDFFRGIVDGDGSVGITCKGLPFVSHGASSPKMAQAFLGFITEVTGAKKTSNPNKRDGTFNIMVFKELAQAMATEMYYPGCLALDRKMLASREVLDWHRPRTMRFRGAPHSWTPTEDATLLTCSVLEAMRILGRSETSIRTRLWRLRGKEKVQ